MTLGNVGSGNYVAANAALDALIAERRANEWVGFQVEGTLRQAMFKDGEYHDRIIMSILPQELRHI